MARAEAEATYCDKHQTALGAEFGRMNEITPASLTRRGRSLKTVSALAYGLIHPSFKVTGVSGVQPSRS